MFKINTRKKLKIWTVITHALIVVGFAHGIQNFAVIEILWFPYITRHPFSFNLSASFEAYLPVVGLTTIIGQILLISSILQKRLYPRISLQIFGLAFLWLSVFYFIQTSYDGDSHFGGFTAIPFALCTILIFLGYSLKKGYDRIINM